MIRPAWEETDLGNYLLDFFQPSICDLIVLVRMLSYNSHMYPTKP